MIQDEVIAAAKRLQDVITLLRLSAEMARLSSTRETKILLGIVTKEPDGSGLVTAELDFQTFVDDLALVVGEPKE